MIALKAATGYNAPSVLYDEGDYDPDVAALALSPDNASVILADRSGWIVSIDAASGTAAKVACGCRPEGLFGLGQSAFRVTGTGQRRIPVIRHRAQRGSVRSARPGSWSHTVKRIPLFLILLAATAFTASAALTITTTSLPNIIVGQPYPVINLQTSGASVGVTWSVSAGVLPTGFVVGAAQVGQPASDGTFCVGTGTPSGAPNCSSPIVQSDPGSYTFTLQAVDSKTSHATQQFTIVVGAPVQITTPSLPNGFVGQPYSFALQTSGGTGPALWAVIGNSQLRQDFALDPSTGIISSPSVGPVGSFSFTVLASDPTGPSASAQFTLTVTLPLQILQTSLPAALQGTLYQTTLTGSGGAPPLQWSLGSGTAGFTIQGSGSTATIIGSAQGLGDISLPVILTDSSGAFLEETFILQVVSQLIITSSPPPPAEVGFAYSQQTTVAGGLAPYAWSISAGALPQGLTLNTSTGLIQGTPTAIGSGQFTLKVSDSSGQVANPTYTISVIAGITVATTSLPFGNTANMYTQTLVSTGGMAPVTWSAPNPPPGLTLSSTGVLSGTPTVLGPQSFVVAVTDLLGHTAQRTLTLTVLGGSGTLSIFGPTSFTATKGIPFAPSPTFVSSGLNPPFTWSISPLTVPPLAVPPGLTLDPVTGRISGTPTVAGQFTFVVQLTDVESQTATAAITIDVLNALGITTTSLPPGIVGIAYSQTLVPAGGATPFTWSLVSGNLPTGIQLNGSTGVLAGMPTALGSQTFTVQVMDSLARTTQQQLTLSIVLPLTITSGGSFTGSVGTLFSSTLGATGGVLPYTWSISSGALRASALLGLNARYGAQSPGRRPLWEPPAWISK